MIFKLTENNNCKIAEFESVRRFTLVLSEGVKTELKPILSEPGTQMILSLKNIDFIDSSGIGCVISLVKTAKSCGSRLLLCDLSKEVWTVFNLLHLEMILNIEPDIESCIQKYGKKE